MCKRLHSVAGQRLVALSLGVLVFVLDQWTKHWVLATLVTYQPHYLWSWLNWTLAFNSGAAFSLLSGPQTWHVWFLIGFTLCMSAFLTGWLLFLKKEHLGQALSLGLILGGALSNLYDRMVFGQVVDWIDVHAGVYHWPVFNVADSAICVGAVLLCWWTKEKGQA